MENKQKYMEFQMITQQLQQLEQQFEKIEEQKMEVDSVLESLEELKNTEPGTDILVPVSSGIFSRATTKDSKNLIVNVGANVAVEKDIAGARSLVEEQRVELLKFQQEVAKQMELLETKAKEIGKEFRG